MPDVNVLVYAHRQDQKKHHSVARDWIDERFDFGQPLALSSLVAVAFVRIVTNPRAFATPTPVPLALSAVDAMVLHPLCRLVPPGDRHWQITSELCRAHNASGKQVADAQHAAVALEHGCEWITFDDDFLRFETNGLRWKLLSST